MTTTRDILNRAADLVERGWCQRKLVNIRKNGTKEYCLVGAITISATGSIDFPWDGMSETTELIETYLGQDTDIVDWNNDPGRTQSEVVSLLRSVAESC